MRTGHEMDCPPEMRKGHAMIEEAEPLAERVRSENRELANMVGNTPMYDCVSCIDDAEWSCRLAEETFAWAQRLQGCRLGLKACNAHVLDL
ncbi:MAG: hypothetical protein ACOC9T_01080 [Myxococcota bacterium]